MKRAIKKYASGLLVAMLLVTCAPMQALGFNDNGNGGNGGGTGSGNSAENILRTKIFPYIPLTMNLLYWQVHF